MISVVAPCLNEEKHLPTFLNSLLHQTFKDFEVIIVDGGSTDRSLWILKEYYSKLDLKVLINKKRNFGYIRNVGASHAQRDIMFHCNTDNYLPPTFLEDLITYYREHPETISVSGRVYPLGTSVIAHVAYQLFDLLRFAFTCAPMPIKKYRPSGSFLSMRNYVWNDVGKYPEVTVNEDGLMGGKIEDYMKQYGLSHKAIAFRLNLYVGHHVKKFESMGGIRALFFYFYTLANFAPMLKPLLEPIRKNASLVFEGKQSQRLTFKQLLWGFWKWL